MVQKLKMTNSSIEVYVDDIDYKWAKYYDWFLDYGYARTSENGEKKYLHKMIAQRMGIIGEVDHKDRFKWNCTRDNLRLSTHSQNCANSRKRDGTSLYKGVYWNKKQAKWQSQICVNYVNIHLGYYELESDAAKAYDDAAIQYFGEFANLNFK